MALPHSNNNQQLTSPVRSAATERVDGRRARAVSGTRSYEVTKLWDHHHQVTRLLVMGMKAKDVAQQLGLSEATIVNIRNSPLCKQLMSQMHAAADVVTVDVAKQIQELAPRAIQAMEDMLEEETPPALRLAAARDILDRAGHGAVKKVDARVAVAAVTPEMLDRVRERAYQAAQAAGMIDDSQPQRLTDGEVINAKVL